MIAIETTAQIHYDAICRFRGIVAGASPIPWEELPGYSQTHLTTMIAALVQGAADPAPWLVDGLREYTEEPSAVTTSPPGEHAVICSCAWLLWRLRRGIGTARDTTDLITLCAEADYEALQLFLGAIGHPPGPRWRELPSAQRMSIAQSVGALIQATEDPLGPAVVTYALEAAEDMPEDRRITGAIVAHAAAIRQIVHAVRDQRTRGVIH